MDRWSPFAVPLAYFFVLFLNVTSTQVRLAVVLTALVFHTRSRMLGVAWLLSPLLQPHTSAAPQAPPRTLNLPSLLLLQDQPTALCLHPWWIYSAPAEPTAWGGLLDIAPPPRRGAAAGLLALWQICHLKWAEKIAFSSLRLSAI